LLIATGLAGAAVIQQDGNAVGIEAEIGTIDNSHDHADRGWIVDGVTDGNYPIPPASGGSYVANTENHTSVPASGNNLLSFDITFSNPGAYTPWFRAAYTMQDFEDSGDADGSNDSFYYDAGDVSDTSRSWEEMNGLLVVTDQWKWFQGGADVSIGSAGQVTWVLSSREDGLLLDGMVLIHEDNPDTIDDAYLDAHVPEPATLALAGLGSLAMVLRRRRG
jgi:hypothetical protein